MTQDHDLSRDEQNKSLFVQLVVMLTTSAMQQMGKLVNPLTGKPELHLEAAEATIDLLDMLRVKTAGHLDEDEQRVLADSLHTLRLNYWETRQNQSGDQSAQAVPEANADKVSETSAKESEDKKPKFQKKYS